MRFSRCILRALTFAALFAATAAQAQEPLRRSREGQPDVYGVEDANAAMNRAMEHARATLAVFNEYLPRAARREVFAELKVAFREGDEVEHMWVTGVTFRDGRYHGILTNAPMALRNVARGDRVSIAPEDVSDWMVVGPDGLMRGGFTVLELRRGMSAKQRNTFDKGLDYRLPPDTAIWNGPRP